MKNFKLCYVDLPWVYFTTQDLDTQWGDDWDDAPYEHNAGEPYRPGKLYFLDGREEKRPEDWNEDGTPKWEIKVVGIFEWREIAEPRDGFGNSPYSVKDINEGVVPWLVINKRKKKWPIYAGTTFEKFLSIMDATEIDVYMKLDTQWWGGEYGL